MSEKKVAVVMSTYNGEKYLKEQMDSILNQTYKNIDIYVRDDGSTDSTKDIIKEYQKTNSNIKLIEGENIGFIKSFFELLKHAEGDYYAYCDQDDIWMENKIELAVNSLDQLDDSKPNMSFGNSDYYDENMNLLKKGPVHRKYSFPMALFSCVTQGMTMTVNKKTRDMIIENTPRTCFFHDWWTYLLCVSMGNIAYSDVTTVKYRRRKENATSEGQGFINLLIWRFKNLIIKDGMRDIKQQMINFKQYYYYAMSREEKDMLILFAEEPYSLGVAFKKAFFRRRLRPRLFDDICLRIVFLVGVL